MVEWRRLWLYHKSDAKNGSNPTVPACCKTYVKSYRASLLQDLRSHECDVLPWHFDSQTCQVFNTKQESCCFLNTASQSSFYTLYTDYKTDLLPWHFDSQTCHFFNTKQESLKKKKKNCQSKQFLHFSDTDCKTPWATLKWKQTESVYKITKEVNSHQLIKRDTTIETWIAYRIYQLPGKAAVSPTGSTNYLARQ